MNENKCMKCFIVFKRKYNLERHYSRKYSCNPLFTQNNPKQSQIIPKQSQIIPKTQKIIPTNCDPTNTTISVLNSIFKCKYCSKEYKSSNGLYKHINEIRCNKIPNNVLKMLIINKKNKIIKKKIENNKELINLSKTEFDLSKTSKTSNITSNTINNTINNNTNNTNNTINITIRAFGNENLDSLTKQDKIEILNKSYNSFTTSLEKVHYNIPENRNFFQPNKNKDYIEYFNGDNWIYENQDQFTNILSNKVITRLETWFDLYKKKLTSSKRILIQKMIDEYGTGKIDKDFNEQTKKYLLSYSNNIKKLMDNEINNIGIVN